MPPTLRLALAVIVAVEQRCQAGARQGLAMLWDHCADDREAAQAGRQIYASLDPSSRHWFGQLGGDRKPSLTS
jgi:hypothetical protein